MPSLDRSQHPTQVGDERLDELIEVAPEARRLPSTEVRRRVQGPQVNSDAAESSVLHGVVDGTRLESQKIGATPHAKMGKLRKHA